MGVTSGGLQPGQFQLITITIPGGLSADQASQLSDDLQAVIDAFNGLHKNNPIEVVS